MSSARLRFKGGPWTNTEDQILLAALSAGNRDWERVASNLKKTAEQCRSRWENYLDPRLHIKEEWSIEEDALLVELAQLFPFQWQLIASQLTKKNTAHHYIRPPWLCEQRYMQLKDMYEYEQKQQSTKVEGEPTVSLEQFMQQRERVWKAQQTHEERQARLDSVSGDASNREEMLNIIVGRLANQDQKKGLRKERGRQLEEASFLARLQNQREARESGTLSLRQSKRMRRALAEDTDLPGRKRVKGEGGEFEDSEDDSEEEPNFTPIDVGKMERESGVQTKARTLLKDLNATAGNKNKAKTATASGSPIGTAPPLLAAGADEVLRRVTQGKSDSSLPPAVRGPIATLQLTDEVAAPPPPAKAFVPGIQWSDMLASAPPLPSEATPGMNDVSVFSSANETGSRPTVDFEALFANIPTPTVDAVAAAAVGATALKTERAELVKTESSLVPPPPPPVRSTVVDKPSAVVEAAAAAPSSSLMQQLQKREEEATKRDEIAHEAVEQAAHYHRVAESAILLESYRLYHAPPEKDTPRSTAHASAESLIEAEAARLVASSPFLQEQNTEEVASSADGKGQPLLSSGPIEEALEEARRALLQQEGPRCEALARMVQLCFVDESLRKWLKEVFLSPAAWRRSIHKEVKKRTGPKEEEDVEDTVTLVHWLKQLLEYVERYWQRQRADRECKWAWVCRLAKEEQEALHAYLIAERKELGQLKAEEQTLQSLYAAQKGRP